MASPFERNQQYVRKGDHEYNTQLSREDEKRFLEWVQKNDVRFDSKERAPDYDMRGFWQALTDPKHPDHAKAQTGVNPNDKQIHYSDYWKTPYHESFSRESQWANKNAPKWNDKDQLVDRSGKVVFDERRQSRATPIEGKPDMARPAQQSSGVTINPRDLDLIARVVASETPNSWLRSESGQNGVKGVIDVILNRASSGSYPGSIEGVLNQKGQFSAVSGNKDAVGSADRLGRASRDMTEFVTGYIRDRANGAPSAVGGALNFANPNWADPRNLGWINAMEKNGGQVFGSGGRDIHVYGTAPGGRPHEATNIRLTRDISTPAAGSARGATHVADRLPDNWPRGGPTASGFNAGIFDRVADRVLRFGNPQALGAPPQRNVVQEMFDKIGRGRAGVRSDAVSPSTQQRQATLREGMSGPQVKALQQDLIKAGLLDAKGADGKFGPQTAAAVRSLEKNFNLPTQDRGIAGREVFGALRGGGMPPPVPQATPTQRTASAATPAIRPDFSQAGPFRGQPTPTAPPPPLTAAPVTTPPAGAMAPGAITWLHGGPSASTAAPPPIPPPSPSPSPTQQPPTPEQLAAHQANVDRLRQSTTTPYPGLTGGMGPGAMGDVRGQPPPLQAPSPGALGAGVFATPFGAMPLQEAPRGSPPPAALAANPPPAATQALGARPATPPVSPAALAANPPPPALAALAAQSLAANPPPPPTAANTPAATINALPDQGGLQIGGRNFPSPQEQLAGGRLANTADVQRTIVGGNIPTALAEQDLMRVAANTPPQGGIPQTMVPSPPGAGMLGSQEARPSIRPDALGPPGGAANYAPRDIGAIARGIESPMFNPPQNTPQFPATGWANAPPPTPPSMPPTPDVLGYFQDERGRRRDDFLTDLSSKIPGIAPPSPPPTGSAPAPPVGRDTENLARSLLEAGVAANTLPQANLPPGSLYQSPAEAQADAERQKNELYQQMDRADALREGSGQSSYFRDLGGGAFTGGASDNLLAGGIPTIQAPSLENIVQPQVGDQGGQGLLGGQGLGDQTQVEGPAAGRSDAQGVLDAISQADFTGVNQQDQQPGGDQGAAASAASGDNPFTPAQLNEQQGILAMLEEMFGSGSTGR